MVYLKNTGTLKAFFIAAILILGTVPDSFALTVPEITLCQAKVAGNAVIIYVTWLSPEPVALIKAAAGGEQKEIEINEYDNERTPHGYIGEETITLQMNPSATGRPDINPPTQGAPIPASQPVVGYFVQLEDSYGKKSKPQTGEIELADVHSAPGGQAPYTDQQHPQGDRFGKELGLQQRQNPDGTTAPADIIEKVLKLKDRFDLAPNVYKIKLNKGPGTRISFTTKANDDKGLREVRVTIKDMNGDVVDEEIIKEIGKLWQGTTRPFVLKPGNYTVVVQAIDINGNYSKEKKERFGIGEVQPPQTETPPVPAGASDQPVQAQPEAEETGEPAPTPSLPPEAGGAPHISGGETPSPHISGTGEPQPHISGSEPPVEASPEPSPPDLEGSGDDTGERQENGDTPTLVTPEPEPALPAPTPPIEPTPRPPKPTPTTSPPTEPAHTSEVETSPDEIHTPRPETDVNPPDKKLDADSTTEIHQNTPNAPETPDTADKPSPNTSTEKKKPVAKIEITPRSLDFGEYKVGSGASKPMWIKNSGTGNLIIKSVFIRDSRGGGGHFSYADIKKLCGSGAIPPGGGCAMTEAVKFFPKSVGEKTAQLVIQSNAGNEPGGITVSLRGRATKKKEAVVITGFFALPNRATPDGIIMFRAKTNRKADYVYLWINYDAQNGGAFRLMKKSDSAGTTWSYEFNLSSENMTEGTYPYKVWLSDKDKFKNKGTFTVRRKSIPSRKVVNPTYRRKSTPPKQIVNPIVSINPASGNQGTSFNVRGNGFTANARIAWYVVRRNGAQISAKSLNADSKGNWTGHFVSSCETIPGAYFIQAIDKTTRKKSNKVQYIIQSKLLRPITRIMSVSPPSRGRAYLKGETVKIKWRIDWFANKKCDRIVLSMKRDDRRTRNLTAPNSKDWYRFTEHGTNDGMEVIKIPDFVTSARDWRFCVKHIDNKKGWTCTRNTFSVKE